MALKCPRALINHRPLSGDAAASPQPRSGKVAPGKQVLSSSPGPAHRVCAAGSLTGAQPWFSPVPLPPPGTARRWSSTERPLPNRAAPSPSSAARAGGRGRAAPSVGWPGGAALACTHPTLTTHPDFSMPQFLVWKLGVRVAASPNPPRQHPWGARGPSRSCPTPLPTATEAWPTANSDRYFLLYDFLFKDLTLAAVGRRRYGCKSSFKFSV